MNAKIIREQYRILIVLSVVVMLLMTSTPCKAGWTLYSSNTEESDVPYDDDINTGENGATWWEKESVASATFTTTNSGISVESASCYSAAGCGAHAWGPSGLAAVSKSVSSNASVGAFWTWQGPPTTPSPVTCDMYIQVNGTLIFSGWTWWAELWGPASATITFQGISTSAASIYDGQERVEEIGHVIAVGSKTLDNTAGFDYIVIQGGEMDDPDWDSNTTAAFDVSLDYSISIDEDYEFEAIAGILQGACSVYTYAGSHAEAGSFAEYASGYGDVDSYASAYGTSAIDLSW